MELTIPSYHDLFITTPKIARISIANLPFRVEVLCTRAAGWQVWVRKETHLPEELLGEEFGGHEWLVLDVAGHVICDRRPKANRVKHMTDNEMKAEYERYAALVIDGHPPLPPYDALSEDHRKLWRGIMELNNNAIQSVCEEILERHTPVSES